MTTAAIQVTSRHNSMQGALETLAGLEVLDGYIGGRAVPSKDREFMAQAFFLPASGVLPDGCRRCLLPATLVLQSRGWAQGVLRSAEADVYR